MKNKYKLLAGLLILSGISEFTDGSNRKKTQNKGPVQKNNKSQISINSSLIKQDQEEKKIDGENKIIDNVTQQIIPLIEEKKKLDEVAQNIDQNKDKIEENLKNTSIDMFNTLVKLEELQKNPNQDDLNKLEESLNILSQQVSQNSDLIEKSSDKIKETSQISGNISDQTASILLQIENSQNQLQNIGKDLVHQQASSLTQEERKIDDENKVIDNVIQQIIPLIEKKEKLDEITQNIDQNKDKIEKTLEQLGNIENESTTKIKKDDTVKQITSLEAVEIMLLSHLSTGLGVEITYLSKDEKTQVNQIYSTLNKLREKLTSEEFAKFQEDANKLNIYLNNGKEEDNAKIRSYSDWINFYLYLEKFYIGESKRESLKKYMTEGGFWGTHLNLLNINTKVGMPELEEYFLQKRTPSDLIKKLNEILNAPKIYTEEQSIYFTILTLINVRKSYLGDEVDEKTEIFLNSVKNTSCSSTQSAAVKSFLDVEFLQFWFLQQVLKNINGLKLNNSFLAENNSGHASIGMALMFFSNLFKKINGDENIKNMKETFVLLHQILSYKNVKAAIFWGDLLNSESSKIDLIMKYVNQRDLYLPSSDLNTMSMTTSFGNLDLQKIWFYLVEAYKIYSHSEDTFKVNVTKTYKSIINTHEGFNKLFLGSNPIFDGFKSVIGEFRYYEMTTEMEKFIK